MQNLSQNEFNQIVEMHRQSRDELERIAKIRRIKNYEEMAKDELIISLLKNFLMIIIIISMITK